MNSLKNKRDAANASAKLFGSSIRYAVAKTPQNAAQMLNSAGDLLHSVAALIRESD